MPLESVQLDRLCSRAAIDELLGRYACAVDRGDWALYETCFTEDAVIDYRAAGGIRGSVTEVARWLNRVTWWLSWQHLIANLEITWSEADPNACQVRAMFHNPVSAWWFPVMRPLFYVGGWYNHEMVRGRDGAWRSRCLREEIAFNQAPRVFATLILGMAAGAVLLRAWGDTLRGPWTWPRRIP